MLKFSYQLGPTLQYYVSLETYKNIFLINPSLSPSKDSYNIIWLKNIFLDIIFMFGSYRLNNKGLSNNVDKSCQNKHILLINVFPSIYFYLIIYYIHVFIYLFNIGN